ncbi:preprotein translocase subunit SecE [Pelotomaculum propionicicum]|uniref:Protein translocase subunit SecE n=1 Tax=Pelotomaculum propionicicum TaxID=258475 RepID=A0A4Y7RJ95_9FIRM|nr:preprotein translocase subunit SecE [Pelotomaculum propionicicum]TEB08903.1 Protein translocase subunit SecE [Pelotomaculum propionicicum]
MVLTKKQDNGNKKKEHGKRETRPKSNEARSFVASDKKAAAHKNTGLKPEKKEFAKKELALIKDKKDIIKKEPTKKEPPVKKEKVNYIELVQKFVKGTLNELKKVHWPTRREIIIYTAVVLVAVAFVGALIWLFDSVLSLILRQIIQR